MEVECELVSKSGARLGPMFTDIFKDLSNLGEACIPVDSANCMTLCGWPPVNSMIDAARPAADGEGRQGEG